ILDGRLSLEQLFAETETAAEVLLRTGICRWNNEARGALIACNKEALIGALLNLIENALQSGGEHTVLQINAHLVPGADSQQGHGTLSWVNISVQDNGPGIN